MGEPIAELDGVEVRRRGTRMLGPVTISVAAGEFVGVVGPNGAGKTTLLRVLAGLVRASAGGLRVFGVDGASRSYPSVARKRIGVLFQRHDFLPDLPFTVQDVVLFGRASVAGLGRWYGDADHRAVDVAIEAIELAPLRRRLFRELSGGERQKTHLARLLAQGAEMLLLDEPAAGLDLAWQERLTGLVERVFAEGGRTVVMVTHEIDRLPRCCARALLMKGGRVSRDGRPEDVFTRQALGGLYGCGMEVVARSGRWHAFGTGEGAG